MKHLAALSALAGAAAQAHEGHGLINPSHWHATDAVGFAVVAIGVVAVLWSRRGK